MNKWAPLIIVCLAIMLAILVFQNRAGVETHIFFVTVVMSHSVLLFLTALAGFILGVLLTWFTLRDKIGTKEP